MKIALIERKQKIDSSKYDKIISFCRDGNTNVDQYYGFEERDVLYKKVYEDFSSWIESDKNDEIFNFQGTHVLSAYGKKIFDFMFDICQKIYVIKKIVEMEKPTELCVAKDVLLVDDRYLSLSFFISDIVPKGISVRYFGSRDHFYIHAPKVSKCLRRVLEICFLIKRKFIVHSSFATKGSVLICSDLGKIPVLFDYLENENVLFLREQIPVRMSIRRMKPNFKLVLLSDFSVSAREKGNIRRVVNRFIRHVGNLEGSITINGNNLVSCVQKYLSMLWKKELACELEKISKTRLLFEKFNVKSLLVDEDRSVYKNLLVQTSKRYTTKSYVNCHGEPFHKIGFLPLTADFIFAWGRKQKEIFTGWGLERDRIIVTGCSKYDKYFGVPAEDVRSKICKDLALTPSQPIVLIAPCPLKDRRNILENVMWEQIRQAMITVTGFKDIQILIKLHAGDDNASHVRSLVSDMKKDSIIVLTDYDPLVLAKGADILVVYSSTFLMDGLAFKKPVIEISKRGMDRYMCLSRIYDGTTTEKLSNSMKILLDNGDKRYLDNWQFTAEYCLNGMKEVASKKISRILSVG
jgi:hypothetical protein